MRVQPNPNAKTMRKRMGNFLKKFLKIEKLGKEPQ